ncbi:MAG: nicotinate-nucleotide diphosphorylase, partial [Shewanella sp.]
MLENDIRVSVKAALDEDLGHLSPSEGDITAQLIPA